MGTEVKRMALWLRALLVVSLGLNLLVLGGIAGGLYRGHFHPHHADRMGGMLSRALAEDDRRAILRELRRASGDARQAQAAVMAGIATDLRAPQFDRARLEQRMAAQRALFGQRLELGQRLLLDRLERMPPAARAALADRLEAGVWHRSR